MYMIFNSFLFLNNRTWKIFFTLFRTRLALYFVFTCQMRIEWACTHVSIFFLLDVQFDWSSWQRLINTFDKCWIRGNKFFCFLFKSQEKLQFCMNYDQSRRQFLWKSFIINGKNSVWTYLSRQLNKKYGKQFVYHAMQQVFFLIRTLLFKCAQFTLADYLFIHL